MQYLDLLPSNALSRQVLGAFISLNSALTKGKAKHAQVLRNSIQFLNENNLFFPYLDKNEYIEKLLTSVDFSLSEANFLKSMADTRLRLDLSYPSWIGSSLWSMADFDNAWFLECVQIFIDNGADVNCLTAGVDPGHNINLAPKKYNLLFWLCQTITNDNQAQIDTIERLIEMGASYTIVIDMHNNNGVLMSIQDYIKNHKSSAKADFGYLIYDFLVDRFPIDEKKKLEKSIPTIFTTDEKRILKI